MLHNMVTRYQSETGKYVYFVNPVWTSLLGSNDTNFDKDCGIVFDQIIEKTQIMTSYPTTRNMF